MIKQGPVSKCTIRVFYPNPIGHITTGTVSGLDSARPNPIDDISKEYNVVYLEVLDPIYHELCFIDDKGIRHRIIGLAYHMQETVEESHGVDAQL
jgi:hypothetical protein